MIKTIIIEDEANAGEMLQKMLQESDSSIEVMDICKDIPSAIKSIKRNQPDLIFLDIELPVYSGLQIFEFLNEDETNFKIIFVTAFNQYAINAFRFSALDYLLKPLRITELKEAVAKAEQRITEKKSTYDYELMLPALTDPDPACRKAAVHWFARARLSPHTVVPILVAGLGDDAMRSDYSEALRSYGADARFIVPALVELSRATNRATASVAAWALVGIEPEGAGRRFRDEGMR